MTEFTTVTSVAAIPEGEGGSYEVNGRMIALFNRGGEFFAIDDRCPHQGASLGAGAMDEEGAVSCPWHAWRFCVADGKWCDNPRLGVDVFEVQIVGDEVQVRVPSME